MRKLLRELGFEEKTVPQSADNPVPGIAFHHVESDCFFAFRPYRPQDRVSMMDFIGVRSQLDWRGLLSEQAFDAALRKASA